MATPLWFWIAFNAAVFVILAVDLGVFHRKAHAISMKEAALSTVVLVSLSLLFAAAVWKIRGPKSGIDFLTGYVIEYALSVDNIFVFVLLFRFFAVPPAYQHRVLFWGILTAVVLRGAMIAAGVSLISRFNWILYLFGAFLLYTGIKMLFHKGAEVDPEQNPVIRFFQRVIPVSHEFEGAKFIVRRAETFHFTPLFLVFIVVNVTDVIFAVDSIPAIFGITVDPFIVYTSNICAVLGLRSLYFLLAGMMDLFTYLQTGLAIVLSFVGVKMLLNEVIHISTPASLAFIVAVLAVSITASMLHQRKAVRT